MINQKVTLSCGAIFGALAVVAGAFAAHSLKLYLTESSLSIWQTAVKYQMYHSLALIAIAILMKLQTEDQSSGWLKASTIAFIIGVVLFSGSLYVLSLTTISWLGVITPIGGLSLIIGWICLAIVPWKTSD